MGQLKQTQGCIASAAVTYKLEEQDTILYPSPYRWVLAHIKQMVGLQFYCVIYFSIVKYLHWTRIHKKKIPQLSLQRLHEVLGHLSI